jgi:hypothetical protein
VIVSGSTDQIGRAELLKLLAEIRPLDHFETDRFIGGHPLRILMRGDEPAARAMAEKLRALGAVVSVEPSPPEFAMPEAISLVSLDDGETTPPPAGVAPEAAPAPAPADDSRFQAPSIAEAAMELDAPLPVPPPRPAPEPEPPISATPPAATPAPPAEDDDGEPPPPTIPGRLFQGQLRRQPGLRLAIGLALGLGIGYAVSAPYQSRAERKVASVRAAADADRWRPVEEARANAARLDEKADELAASAFVTTLAIWLGAAAAVTAGWYRAT